MSLPEFLRWIDERLVAALEGAEALRPRLGRLLQGGRLEVPDDLTVQDSGLQFSEGGEELETLWFQLEEREGGQAYPGFRAVRLLHLASIPLNVRGDQGSLARMRTVLRGLYSARVDLVYLVAGIYHPERVGIVQCYGAVGRGDTREAASQRALHGAGCLEAAMAAAYPQLRLRGLDARLAGWIHAALGEMPHGVVAVGHPDPRENARGGQGDLEPLLVSNSHPPREYTLQQNELVMRGMARLEEDFLLQVLLTPVSMQAAAGMLTGLAEYTSAWAAWQTGQRSFNLGTSLPLMLSGALARGASSGYSESAAVGGSDGVSHVESRSHTEGSSQSHSQGGSVTSGSSDTHTQGQSVTESHSESSSLSTGGSQSRTEGEGWNVGASLGVPGVASVSGGYNTFSSESEGGFASETQTVTDGVAATRSESDAHTSSHSSSASWMETAGTMQSDTVGSADGVSHEDSWSAGQASSRGLSQALSQGIAFGLAPHVSLGEANQWQFDPAILLTAILRRQQEILNTITLEGGYYTDVYALAMSERGRQALLALIPEAFHGVEEVVTGVQARTLTEAEEEYLRLHARTMVPSTREIHLPEVMSAYADSTLLTMLQASAYLAPGLFEEGLARTVQEAIPPFAFTPQMGGEVALARLYSSEVGRLTNSLLRLGPSAHFHTAFAADTGFGKSVAAERLAYETTRCWHYRTIVLDFGQGWRRAVNWPGLAGRVDIRQLHPGGIRPLRWNPLQVPRRIDPARYRTLVCELFANAGRMGPRQLGFLRDRLTVLYQLHGVLPGIPSARPRPAASGKGKKDEQEAKEAQASEAEKQLAASLEKWRTVCCQEEQEAVQKARLQAGVRERLPLYTPLAGLESYERQALAVHRSRAVSLAGWVELLRREFIYVSSQRDQASRASLQGVLLRLEPLAEGGMQRMYGPGTKTLAVEDLGLLGSAEDPWGVTVLEGGAEMDEFSKSALLSLAASILYLDSVARRRESLGGVHFPPMQIFFEEANKVLTGVDIDSASDREGGGSDQVAQIFLDMWRDGRKYGCFLHVLAQSIAELPPGILSSCNNGFFGQTKNDRDRQAILAHLARSTKGFVNSEYDRFLARMPVGMAIAKLGYTQEITATEPYLVQPLMLEVAEPDDANLLEIFKPAAGQEPKEKP